MRILLPVSWPIIMVSVIWQFTGIWNDFLFGSFSGRFRPPVTGGAEQPRQHLDRAPRPTTSTWPPPIITALPTIAVYVAAGRYFVRGLMAGSVKG